jgi:hypothetical protein
MKKIIFTLLLFSFGAPFFAQEEDEVVVPENYLLKKAEHYEEYKPVLLQVTKWFLDTPRDKEPNKRIKAAKFIIDYANGCPDLTIMLDKRFLNTHPSNSDILVVFMAAYMSNAYENDEESDFKNNYAAVNACLKYYKKNRDNYIKDKNLEKLTKMKDKGKLKDYVKKFSK